MTRRWLLAAAMARREEFRWAICSETFPGKTFAEICAAARRTGYTGIEIEPSNLSPDPAALTATERQSIRKTMADHGLAFVGFHSFLKAPAGLHLTTNDDVVRERTWKYFASLIDLAADLGERPLLVLGSSKQRQALAGVTPVLAASRLQEGLARMAPLAAKRDVTILVEPLAPHLCNVVNTIEEALRVTGGHRHVKTMLDTHNTAGEALPVADLIRKHRANIRHVHLNEMDGRYPGSGSFDFAAVLNTLREIHYRGWVSVEVFDFQPDGETVAAKSKSHLDALIRRMKK